MTPEPDVGHNRHLARDTMADQVNHLHPWEDLGKWRRSERYLVTHGEGIYLHDAEGRKLIDGPAGMRAF
ncbi:MAG: hypothetical protein Q8O82_08670 [Pseudorhodobacter sp.]|nr:hypothetical protein [Pseudorhodobacter sp.]